MSGSRFTRQRPLGRGGTGVVYEAIDDETGAPVALKTLHTATPDDVVRLKTEFRSLAGVHHPNLVDLYELVVTDGGECMLAMELVDGTSFLEFVRPGARVGAAAQPEDVTTSVTRTVSGEQSVLDRPVRSRTAGGTLDVARLRSALAQLVEALGALHAAGTVHRDLKPGNVMVTHDGRVKLLDFGLAIRQGDKAEHVEGTPIYMAPEQIAGEAATPAADAYALGVMLYQALSGAVPFGDRATAVVEKLRHRPTPVRELVPDAPTDLADLCDRLLSPRPVDRPSGSEIAAVVGSAAYEGARSDGELVGRDAETDRLLGALDASKRSGEAHLVFVSGPSGVGKSALVEGVCRRVELGGLGLVLRGRCSEREVVAYPGLDGVVDGLRTALAQWRFDRVREECAEARRDLGQLFPIVADQVGVRASADAVEARAAAARGLHQLLAAVGKVAPVVVVLDDMQWLTQDAAAILASALRRGPLALTLYGTVRETSATERPGLPPSELAKLLGLHADTLALGKLEHDAAATIVRRVAGTDVPDDAVERLVSESGGHPLLLDMLARSWTAGSTSAGGDRALVERPLARVDPLVRTVLEHVAIASEGISLQCLAEVVGVPVAAMVGLTNELQRMRLVRASGIGRRSAVNVAHDRIRAAALASLSGTRVVEMHRAIGSATEKLEPERVEVLVHHFDAAGDAERVGRYAQRAGEAAARVLAFDRAARWYAIALEHGRGADAALRASRAEALALAGRAQESAREFERAADTRNGDAILLHRATDQYLRAGAVERGVELLRRVLVPWGIHVPRSPRGALVALLFRRAQLWFRGLGFRARTAAEAPKDLLDKVDALGAASSGLALVDNIMGSYFQTTSLLLALRAGEPGRVVRSLAVEAAYSSSEGPAGAARTKRLIERTREVARAVGTPDARAWERAATAFASTLETRWKDGVEGARDGQRIFGTEVPGSYWEVATLRLFESFSLSYLGRWSELRKLVEQRHAEALERGDAHARVIQATSSPGISLVASGEAETMLARAAEAMGVWNRSGFHVETWWRAYAVGMALLYLGRVDEALEEYRVMWPGLERSLLLMVHLTRSEAWFMRGNIALAARVRGASREHDAMASRAARLLAKEKSAFARGLGASLAAAHARMRGEKAESMAHLAVAERELTAAEMATHAAAVRWSLARIRGDESAAGREEEVLRASGVARPRRFVGALVGAHDLADPIA